jgi:hypothetical protein
LSRFLAFISLQTPRAYRWIFDISFPGWGVGAAIRNELEGLTLVDNCPPSAGPSCVPGTGDALLQSLGLDKIDVGYACLWLFLESCVFRLLAYFAMHFMYTGQSFKDRLRALLP